MILVAGGIWPGSIWEGVLVTGSSTNSRMCPLPFAPHASLSAAWPDVRRGSQTLRDRRPREHEPVTCQTRHHCTHKG
jgi:hypothetical protein